MYNYIQYISTIYQLLIISSILKWHSNDRRWCSANWKRPLTSELSVNGMWFSKIASHTLSCAPRYTESTMVLWDWLWRYFIIHLAFCKTRIWKRSLQQDFKSTNRQNPGRTKYDKHQCTRHHYRSGQSEDRRDVGSYGFLERLTW